MNKNLPPSSMPPLRWIPQFWEMSWKRIHSQTRLLRWAVLVGIVAGLGGVVFYLATQIVAHYALGVWAGYLPISPGGEAPLTWLNRVDGPLCPWLLLVIPTIGGVISGFIIYRFAPEAEGHGTDAAIAAYHNKDGYIRPRVPPIKLFTSAVTIGTGGSGGREGPIVQIGAGFGSLLADLMRLRPADRRVLMAAGMGAGVAAIFRAPLAGALFAAEVLYWSPEFESEIVLPAGIASVVSYSTFGAFFFWLETAL